MLCLISGGARVVDRHETLIAWLNNAYAMETQLVPVLTAHAGEPGVSNAARQRLIEHATESQRHAARLEEALTQLGTSHSVLKSAIGSVMGVVQSVETTLFSDKVVKNALMDYAAEQFEIAAYQALIVAANELGEIEVAALCRRNLEEDRQMVAWLEEQLPSIVVETLNRATV
jgi:ferritin-like metal-binding protein YciE